MITTYEAVLEIPKEDIYELVASYETIEEGAIEEKEFLDYLVDFFTNPVVVMILLLTILFIGTLYILAGKRKNERSNQTKGKE